ncbi:DUF2273 domain-containing protein [Jeotgalibacillus sp. R-1-5s-1]|uniref:DUF2273 domain-containing protein n=1 Tax=Jeotgalibacillus sp. R-1-5s-1 TaxID=2555897 RepID=UPI00106B8C55|nr:DUF2273 domain-containing protein [Jeotgalibacillus sp. R-1-5s-1]TFE00137.1 DUF2273 domain-containing protein [Jeotgalibacillus sp. R-1-5s-1]
MNKTDMLLPYRGRLLGLVLGVILAILIITVGFGPTLLIVTLAVLGYLVGMWRDGKLDIDGWFQFFTRRR